MYSVITPTQRRGGQASRRDTWRAPGGSARRLVRRTCYPRVEVEIAREAALVDVTGQGFDAGMRLAEAVPPT